MRTVAGMLLTLLLATVAYADDLDPTIKVYPKFGFAPLSVRVTYRIPRAPENRVVCVVFEGGMSSSSCRDWNGDQEPITTEVWYPDLPVGCYAIEIQVRRRDGTVKVAGDRFTVLPGLGDREITCDQTRNEA